jgi:putative DNA primase/helicase
MVRVQDDSGHSLLQLAANYLAAGISILPIKADGSKAPDWRVLPRIPKDPTEPDGELKYSWDPFKENLPTLDELQEWYGDGAPLRGIAAIGGKVSGGLECIDFDEASLLEPWIELVEARRPGLVKKLTINNTPRPGAHVVYRCSVTAGNTGLAFTPELNPKTGKVERKVLVETRGQGGYFLLPGSPWECNPVESGAVYSHRSGPPITQLSVISPEERQILWEAAQSLDQWFEDADIESGPKRSAEDNGKLRPGDDYNRRGPSWGEILGSGWEEIQPNRWRRPGKQGKAWSATTGCKSSDGTELFIVFSSNAPPFENSRPNGKIGKPYSKFAAYTLLHHGGDFSAAARALASQRYGSPPRQEPDQR